MLRIRNLHVEVAGSEVLKGVDLHIAPGETFILFGPNGSGKTTLLMTLMGFGDYKVTGGSIIFKGVDITRAPMYERARLGIGMSFQRPPTIHGLPVRSLVSLCGRSLPDLDVEALAKRVDFDRFLDRDVNAGFSGGEIKRSEMLQLMAQRPDLVLFDEPESGVDIENIALIGNTARRLLSTPAREQDPCAKKHQRSTKSGLIITHTGYILNYVDADRGQVMYQGRLCCEARPREILDQVRERGYKDCLSCFMGDEAGRIFDSPEQAGGVQ